MSIPKYQDRSPLQPNFQRICRPECAIEDPDGGMENEYLSRRVVFNCMRSVICRQIAEGGRALVDSSYDTEAERLFSQAEVCAGRIKAGECGKFLLNSGQYSNLTLGIMTYEEAAYTVSQRGKEE